MAVNRLLKSCAMPPGELPHGFHLLRLTELHLERASIGDVGEHSDDARRRTRLIEADTPVELEPPHDALGQDHAKREREVGEIPNRLLDGLTHARAIVGMRPLVELTLRDPTGARCKSQQAGERLREHDP
jgi:hypothetical protein